jgi:hypothetical protein
MNSVVNGMFTTSPRIGSTSSRRTDTTITFLSHLDVHDSDLVLPLDALPVSAEATADFWEIIGPACRMLIPAAPISPGSFQEFLTSLEPWEASLFHTIELRHPPHEIVRYLTEETFLGVSDGAEKFKCAAFRWILSRANGHRLVRCAGPVYGADPSSFPHSELKAMAFSRCSGSSCD